MGNDLKFCKHCGEKIPADAVICTKCGRQVEEIENKMPQIINNVASSASSSASSAASANVAERPIRYVKKWVAFTAIPIGNFGKGRPLKKRAGVA